MPSMTFTTSWGRFDGSKTALLISPSELIEQYFHGIPLCAADGKTISNDVFIQKILAAQAKIEEQLSIKLFRQIYEEKRDFILDQWRSWGFMGLTYLIKGVTELKGWLGGVTQVDYPIGWISIHETTDDRGLYRQLNLVPAGAASNIEVNNSVVAIGITPHAGFLGLSSIPNYWKVSYETGFNQVPYELVEIIGKMAAIPVLTMLGDLILGLGIASYSVSYDGLSESTSTTKSSTAGVFSARIKQYNDDVAREMKELRDYYVGITMVVM